MCRGDGLDASDGYRRPGTAVNDRVQDIGAALVLDSVPRRKGRIQARADDGVVGVIAAGADEIVSASRRVKSAPIRREADEPRTRPAPARP